VDKLLDTLNNYLTSANKVVMQYGPKVWEATLSLIRIDAIFNLVLLAVFTVIVVALGLKAIPWVYRKAADEDDHPGWIIASVFGSIGWIVGAVAVTVGWACSLPYWIGIFRPDLAVLYRVAQQAGLL
jgi:heme/copper-type cytochrome/quinol oxidase subunit 2